MLIKNISVLDVENGKVIEGLDIYIKGNLISDIGKDLHIDDSEVIDGKNKLALPGFINAHTHLGMSLLRNYADDYKLKEWLEEKIWPIEAKLDPEDIYIGTLLSMVEMIKSGTTTFCDMYYEMERVAEATIESGLRGMITRGLGDLMGPPSPEERLAGMKKLYDDYNGKGEGRLKVFPGPHAIYTSTDKFLKDTVKLAKECGNRIHIHLSETESEVKDSLRDRGMTPIAFCDSLGLLDQPTIAAHCTHITDEEIDLVKNKEFFPVYNPTSNLKLASGFTPVKKMLDGGLKVCIGTDGDSSNNNLNMVEEIHIASVVNKAVEKDATALKAIDVIKMATINGARAFGINAGEIKIGKLADITIFNLNSVNFTPRNNLISAICYSASSEDVDTVIVDGRVLMRNRKLLTLNEEEIIKKAQEKMDALLKR
ncbi:amidohydrolase [Peptoniphilus catoniae]|uniref:amidohydrolase n=1 Tax=Peptoniphilus catoniae TaxID=1660341 RepID=UPI0010FED372|nr:amidohydrolase [Peptoniphilus catoniae]